MFWGRKLVFLGENVIFGDKIGISGEKRRVFGDKTGISGAEYHILGESYYFSENVIFLVEKQYLWAMSTL